MPYAVDGNNLIGALTGRGRPDASERDGLVRRLAASLRRSRARITIVFDGDGPAGRSRASLGPIEVRYARSGPADDEIARLVRGAARPTEWIVVTDDRDLARRVRDSGARISSTSEFWSAFGSPEPEAGKPPEGDAAAWEEYFADERNRLA